MSLARCECGQVFDIPGVPRSYKQPDGRCMKCSGTNGEPAMEIPQNVKSVFKVESMTAGPPGYRAPLKIESGVPYIPDDKKPANRLGMKPVYPFLDMKPPRADGSMDSFFIRRENNTDMKKLLKRAKSSFYNFRSRYKGKKEAKYEFRARIVGDGVRVWRVK